MKAKLRRLIEDNTTRSGKIFDHFIQVLIFSSLVSFTIETVPNISENTVEILNVFELVSVVIFSLEYVARIYVTPNSFKYIFSF
jgi:voltage-gated potassium channel